MFAGDKLERETSGFGILKRSYEVWDRDFRK